MTKKFGESGAFQYAEVYAQWGERAPALEWLATAVRLRDPGLWDILVDPMLDPIRNLPEFRKIAATLDAGVSK